MVSPIPNQSSSVCWNTTSSDGALGGGDGDGTVVVCTGG
jgi:hypothetical protein